MVSREDLESFLIRMDLNYDEVADGMYMVQTRDDGPKIVVDHSPPVLVVRLKVMDLPPGADGALFRALLEFNVTDIVHGAYGIEDNELIISDTLELENLDFPELQASLESLTLAASGHMTTIQRLAAGTEA